MKKTLSLLAAIWCMQSAFGFTSNDITIAQKLADKGIIVDRSTDPIRYRLDDSITRAELLAIALKVKGITPPNAYSCQNYYADVNQNQDWICRVVEMAADEGIITRENKKFRPNDTVTQAESLAILLRAGDIQITQDCGGYGCESISMDSSADWQFPIFMTGIVNGFLIPDSVLQTYENAVVHFHYTFHPQKTATRSVIFSEANNILTLKEYPTYEPTPTEPVPPTGSLTAEQILAVTQDAYREGKKSADILLLEYADLECPFCKRMHDDGTVTDLQKKYGDELSFIFKPYPLPFHPLALPAAIAAECVGEQGGSDAYYIFIDKLYSYDTPSQENIDAILVDMKLQNDTLDTCLTDPEIQARIDAQTVEGQNTFGINGTPGNVLINIKTGKYEVVSGAQPTQNFVDAIERLLANV